MLGKNKTAFSDLLTKIDAIDISASSSSNDALATQFSNIENEYKKIREATLSKLEEIKITSDILNQNNTSNHIEKTKENPLKFATDKLILKRGANPSFEMQEKMIPFNLKKGNWLLRQGRIDEALDMWEEGLKINPHNETIHEKLSQLAAKRVLEKDLAKVLLDRYRFRYMGSFGNGMLTNPLEILLWEKRNELLVSDSLENRVHRFSTQGQYLGFVPVKVQYPVGLSKDPEQNIWICDFGNRRLVVVDPDCQPVEEIDMTILLGKKAVSQHPLFCHIQDKWLYVLITDEQFGHRNLLSLDRHNRTATETVSTEDMVTPNYLGVIEDELFICDMAQCRVFRGKAPSFHFRSFGPPDIPFPLKRLAVHRSRLYLSAGNTIIKLSSEGNRIFTANIPNILNRTLANPVGLTILEDRDGKTLFVTDTYLACIHRFDI